MYPLQENPPVKIWRVRSTALKHLSLSWEAVSEKVKDGSQQLVNFSQCFSDDPGTGVDSHHSVRFPSVKMMLVLHTVLREWYPPDASFNVLQ